MPSLAVSVVCEKAILEDGTKTPSLISLFTNVNLKIPSNQLPPDNAAIPKEWAVACGWDIADKDPTGEYTEHIEVFWPDGKTFQAGELKLQMQQGKRHYGIIRFLAFPIGQHGKCKIRVWLEYGGNQIGDSWWMQLEIQHDIEEVVSTDAKL